MDITPQQPHRMHTPDAAVHRPTSKADRYVTQQQPVSKHHRRTLATQQIHTQTTTTTSAAEPGRYF